MNDQQLETKIRHDTARLKKDIGSLVDDGAAQIGSIKEKVGKAPGKVKEDLNSWVDDGISGLSENFEELKGSAMEAVAGVAATVKKDVEHGLSQYNAKAQELADNVPGGFSEKAARYPWVTISIALVVGLMVGGLFRKPRPVWPFGWF